MAMEDLVPKFESLADVYSDPSASKGIAPEHTKRWNNLLKTFTDIYGHSPDFVARSPGRVNIIGEHIDYSLYDVLPMAVTVDALIAVKIAPGSGEKPKVKIANLNPKKFPSREFEIPVGEDIEIDSSKLEWTNYFKAGLRGALEFLRNKYDKNMIPASMEIVMDGNVPAGGGMSSSAALVCASALAVMEANNHDVSKHDLLDLAVVSERAVGVFSGGMDQAASIFSKRDYLLDCAFFPSFSEEHVEVPRSDPEITFLVAQSFVAADKHVTAPKHYNLRVVECTLAAVTLAKMHDIQLEPDSSPLGFSLRNLQEEIMKKKDKLSLPLEEQLLEMKSVAEQKLTAEEGYTREDVANILKISVSDLEEKHLSKFPIQADAFQLRRRALHVFQEAKRVFDFKSILADGQNHGDMLDEEKLTALGDLMNQTQTSCSQFYDCSCPELDEICDIARKAGTFGSRLTGAGWGGCTVHLVPESKVEQVMEALRKEYYSKHFPDITEEKLKEAMVISKPSQGSSVIIGAALNTV
jgi:galactokinase